MSRRLTVVLVRTRALDYWSARGSAAGECGSGGRRENTWGRSDEVSRPTCRLPAVWLAGVCLLASLSGCANWRAEEKVASKLLPQPKLSATSVAIEVVQVHFDGQQAGDLEQIWQEVEEPLPVELRRRLEHNGFWCGVTGMQLPMPLRRQLDRPQSDLPDEEGQMPSKAQRMQCRRGARKPWVCRPSSDELNVLMRSEDGALRGRTYDSARCVMAIRCFPNGDGSVRLQLTPEIEHGETKPRHYGDGGLWQVRVGQLREAFDDLASELTIAPGQTVVLSGTPDQKGLGGSFFHTDNGRSIMLVRLVQTQLDNLFEPTSSAALSDS